MQPATLQQLINQISSICNAHAQIRSFQYCESAEINTEQPLPMVIILVSDTSQTGIVISYRFTMLVMDLVNKNEDNKYSVSSSTMEIAKDILAQLRIPNDYHILDEGSISYRGVYDNQDVDATGWAVEFTLKSVSLFDSCSVPGIAIDDEGGNILTDEENNIMVYE